MTQGKRQGVYVVRALPSAWVAIDDGGAWIVDLRPGGWERRKPYRGHMGALEHCLPGVALGLCMASDAPRTLAQDGGRA